MKRFIDCIIPFRTCNLQCSYCYITHTRSWGNSLPIFQYDAAWIGRALSAKRLGGICLVNICGDGETLLPPEMPRIISSILKQGHFVMVVTNGTVSKRFDEIVGLPGDYLDRLMFKFSYHYLELKRKKWLNVFFDNVEKVRNAGCSISVELTPCDEMIPHIDDAMNLCRRKTGAIPHVTVARDERDPSLPILTGLSEAEYMGIWSKFQSKLFNFKMRVFGEKRSDYCYAGLWSAWLNLLSGDLRQCYREQKLQNIFEDLERPIKFAPVGRHCSQPHCYNAHAFMTLGVIPSVSTPRFSEMRNRVCEDGSEWLKPKMKAFLSGKLADENRELTGIEKFIYEVRGKAMRSRVLRKTRSILSRK